MGLFGKKKHDTVEQSSSGIDFSAYELDELGADIRSIINVPGAIGQAAKYALTLPFIVAIIVWAVFSSRMAGWVLVPFSIVAFVLAFFASLVVGGFFVARKRLDTVADASQRVVDVVGQMHGDVVRVKDGHADTSVQQVAIGLLEEAIFPAVFGSIAGTAEAAMGPVGRLAGSVTKAPLNMVQKSVISAIESLPDREIGDIVADVGDSVPQLEKLSTEYVQIRDKMETIVDKVSRTALGSVLGLAMFSAIPLLIWLVLGWLLS